MPFGVTAVYWPGRPQRRSMKTKIGLGPYEVEKWTMMNRIRTCLLSSLAALSITSSLAAAQEQKPNILFIMGDDIGWMQPSIYHQGLAVGETPNIDRIGHEGASS